MSREDQKRRDELRRIVDRAQNHANQMIQQSNIGERRREAMEAHPDYQRRVRLGFDGRMREAVEIQARQIHERDHHGEAVPSYTKAQEQAAARAERIKQKLGR